MMIAWNITDYSQSPPTLRPYIGNGLSAYQLAVQNGFSGSEAEWVDSLKVVQGPYDLIPSTTTLTYTGNLLTQVSQLFSDGSILRTTLTYTNGKLIEVEKEFIDPATETSLMGTATLPFTLGA